MLTRPQSSRPRPEKARPRPKNLVLRPRPRLNITAYNQIFIVKAIEPVDSGAQEGISK